MKRNFAILSALTVISLSGAAVVSAQVNPPIPMPNVERRIFRVPTPAQSYLGVQTENVSNENFGKYNLNEARGVAVTKVLENSPAARAGLREKDVILAFDGEQVKSVTKLLRLIAEVAPDQKARLTIYRNGGEQEITVTMGKREPQQFESFGNLPQFPNGEFRQTIPLNPGQLPENFRGFEFPGMPDGDDVLPPRTFNGRKLGVLVQPLTKQLGATYGAPEGKGLLVTEVTEQSAAAKAGLRAGDVILEIDGASVATQIDLIRALNNKSEGAVSIVILRDKQRQTISATPEGKAVAPANNGTKFKI